jgi:hypothetical protein
MPVRYLRSTSTSYDYERQVASVQITAFIQQGDLWERIDEVHQERGYPLEEIQDSLASAGFEILAVFGSLRDLSAPKAGQQPGLVPGEAAGLIAPDLVSGPIPNAVKHFSGELAGLRVLAAGMVRRQQPGQSLSQFMQDIMAK